MLEGRPRRLLLPILACLAGASVVGGCGGGAKPVTSGQAGRAPKTEGIRPFGKPPRLFAPSSIWNAPLPDDAPLAPGSRTYVGGLVDQIRRFGAYINTQQFSTPVYVVGAAQPNVRVDVTDLERYKAKDLQVQFEAVPLPSYAVAAAGSDRHLTLYQPSTDTLWDFFNLRREGRRWLVRWGGRIDGVSRSPGVLPAPFGATATGYPVAAGLIYPEELTAGRIDHALALTIPETKAGRWALPATRTDGQIADQSAVREGTRFRLPADLDVDALGLSAPATAIARAAQRYGMVVRDKGGAVTLYAEDRSSDAFKYRPLFGDTDPAMLLKDFPWSKLQAVAYKEGRY